jgi:hypothetical protein
MAEQRHSQSPPESQLWEETVSSVPSPHLGTSTAPHFWPVLLTRRRHTHTTRSVAVGALPCDTGQRVAAASPHTGTGPRLHDERSPTTQGTSPTLCDGWIPPQPSPLAPHLPSGHPAPAHSAGVRQVSWLRAERTEAPRVGGQLRCGLQDSLAVPQVITGITVKISAQPSHTATEVGRQLYLYPGAWQASL